MLLDTFTSLVRRLGPFGAAAVVTVCATLLSALGTVVTMTVMGLGMFPALYLAIVTPLALAFPITYLTNLAIQRADLAQQSGRQSAHEAQAAEALLNDAIEGFTGSFALFDTDDRLIMCNQQHRDMYGEIADLIVPGVSFEELVRAVAANNLILNTPSPEAYVQSRLQRRRNPQEPFEQQLSDGRWVLINEQHTKHGHLVVVRTDITAQKRAFEALRESEERFFKVFQTSPVMIGINDAENGRFYDVNETWLRTLGYERDDVIGRTAIELRLWTEPNRRLDLIKLLRDNGSTRRFPMQFRTRHGHVLDCNISAETVELDGRLHYLFVTEDESERRRIDRLKNEFIANVSHEIRTPLTSINGSLSLLAGGAAGDIPDSARRLLTIAQNNGERLVRLVNDILDIEKIESGQMAFRNQPIEINSFAEQALIVNQAYGDQYGVHFTFTHGEPDSTVHADRDRLDQVFANLLSNAAKFSPRDSDVEVSVARQNGMIRTAVTDHGPGIPEEFRDRIFDKFTQADTSDSRRIKGTGLGLNIVKQIVEQMGGTVGCKHNSGHGTTFYFDLPDWRPGDPSIERVADSES